MLRVQRDEELTLAQVRYYDMIVVDRHAEQQKQAAANITSMMRHTIIYDIVDAAHADTPFRRCLPFRLMLTPITPPPPPPLLSSDAAIRAAPPPMLTMLPYVTLTPLILLPTLRHGYAAAAYAQPRLKAAPRGAALR